MSKSCLYSLLFLFASLSVSAQFDAKNSLDISFSSLKPQNPSVFDEYGELTLSNFDPGSEFSMNLTRRLSPSIFLGVTGNYFFFSGLDNNPASENAKGVSMKGFGVGLSGKYILNLDSRAKPFVMAVFGVESNNVKHDQLTYQLATPILDFETNDDELFNQNFLVTRPKVDYSSGNIYKKLILGLNYRIDKNKSLMASYGFKVQNFNETYYLGDKLSYSSISLGITLHINRQKFL